MVSLLGARSQTRTTTESSAVIGSSSTSSCRPIRSAPSPAARLAWIAVAQQVGEHVLQIAAEHADAQRLGRIEAEIEGGQGAILERELLAHGVVGRLEQPGVDLEHAQAREEAAEGADGVAVQAVADGAQLGREPPAAAAGQLRREAPQAAGVADQGGEAGIADGEVQADAVGPPEGLELADVAVEAIEGLAGAEQAL